MFHQNNWLPCTVSRLVWPGRNDHTKIAILKKALFYYFLFAFAALSGCVTAQPVDRNATKETQALYKNLQQVLTKGILFGHQDPLAYGVGWKYEAGRSDIKDVTGEYPAVYGWDFSGLERGDGTKNIDGVPFDKMKQFIEEGYSKGGVITMSWHVNHPVTGKDAWDTTHGAVAAVLPGGSANSTYTKWLDNVARYALSLKGPKGELIPILFRPFHEFTGNWFWWCQNTCTKEEFIQLWRYTVTYLRDTKQVHNLIYVYNTSDINSATQFLDRYPGDEYVDMISFDSYQSGSTIKDMEAFRDKIDRQLSILDTVAREHKKIPAIGETGYEAIPYPEWWTKVLWDAMKNHRLSYVLVWRNHGMQENGHMHYYAPYKGQASEADFKKFFGLERMFFENKTKQQHLYSD